MKREKNIIILSIILVFYGCVSFFTLPVIADNSAEQARESVAVVAILADYVDASGKNVSNEIQSWGTGMFIGAKGEDPKYIVTNYHVVDYFIDYESGKWNVDDKGTIALRFRLGVYLDSKKYVEAYAVTNAYDKVKDIAILELSKPVTNRVPIPLKIPEDKMVGKNIWAVGYPGIAEDINPLEQWGKTDVTVTKGSITKLERQEGTGVKYIQTDAYINHGNSGGPMVDKDGNAIALSTLSHSDSENMNYGVNISEVKDLLDRNNLPYYLAEDSEITDDKNENSIIQGDNSFDNTGVSTNESGEELNAKDDNAETKVDGDNNTTGGDVKTTVETDENISGGNNRDNILLFVIASVVIVVAIVLGIVVVIVVKKIKKPEPPMPQPTPQPVTNPILNKEEPVVQSLSTQHRGEKVSVGNRQILIGRDSSAQIIYQEGTPGISLRHCTLSYNFEAKEFILTDLKSTYGTFLMNGQKLALGGSARLKPGDSFYLGDNANVLRVELEG